MFQPIVVITVVLLGYFLEKTAAPFFPCRILRMKTSFYCQQCDVFQGKELMTGHDSLQEGKTSLLQSTKRQADCLCSVWGYFLKPKDTWCDCHILAVMETQSVLKTVTFGSPAPSETVYNRAKLK